MPLETITGTGGLPNARWLSTGYLLSPPETLTAGMARYLMTRKKQNPVLTMRTVRTHGEDILAIAKGVKMESTVLMART
jgi:hypothetical protein